MVTFITLFVFAAGIFLCYSTLRRHLALSLRPEEPELSIVVSVIRQGPDRCAHHHETFPIAQDDLDFFQSLSSERLEDEMANYAVMTAFMVLDHAEFPLWSDDTLLVHSDDIPGVWGFTPEFAHLRLVGVKRDEIEDDEIEDDEIGGDFHIVDEAEQAR